jgi:predicted metal-dependent peptidase
MNLKLTRSRTQLLLKHPFFGTLALKLKVVEESIKTMATDGHHLFYNDKFVNSLTEDELTGVVCHELLHCALMHMYRRGDREPKKWNYACDQVINEMLLKTFGMHLPADRVYDAIYDGLSAEEVYNRIPDPEEMPQWGTFTAPSNQGTVHEQEAEWGIALKQAVEAAKAAGESIGHLAELVKLSESKVNWREQLSRLIGSHAKTDYSWMKPNPTYLHRNFVIPTLSEPSIGHLTFAIDTSGSVNNDELSQFLGELHHVLENVHFESITVLECDTEINKVTEYERDDSIEAKVHGRGGTYFAPVFDYIKKHPTNGLIYFTDMAPCDRWPDDPGIPVFWARTTRRSAPYGEHIDLYTHS